MKIEFISGSVLILIQFFYSLLLPGFFPATADNHSKFRQWDRKIESRPSATVINSQITTVCDTASVDFSSSSDNNPVSWQWIFTNGLPANSMEENPQDILYSGSGEYAVQLIACGPAGCDTVTTMVTVDISGAPVAAFEYSMDATCDSFKLTTTNLSQNATEYQWNFGDGNSSTEFSPVHDYLFTEDLVISLTVKNGNCSDAAIADSIPFNVNFFYDIPNVITPNADGLNDCFKIEGIEIFSECLSVDIYTRWGSIVFSSVNEVVCWDGRDQSNVGLPDGVYFYVISVDRLKRRGTVEILR